MKILMYTYTEIDIPMDMFHIKFVVVCHNFVYFVRRFDIRFFIVPLINMDISFSKMKPLINIAEKFVS